MLPSLAAAQAIGGTVSDTTGAVLPGVTVEARSPALIEQVRTAVTDGSGQYLIVQLEPGTYSVTFGLPGFTTLVREGVELSTGFTANVDAALSVGAIEETVTVTQASPTIDVQSIRQTEIIDREVFEVLPTQRAYDSMALLIPAMNIQGGPTTTLSVDTGGIGGEGNNRLTIHGSTETDSEVQVDGLDIGMVAMEGAPQGTPFDAAIEEYVYDYSGNSAEVETGGVRMNLIPKEGGNTFSGGFFSGISHSSWLANNVSQEIVDRGITGGKDGGVKMDQSWTVAPSIGGPIVRDKLWFFTSYSFRRGSIFPANLFNSQDTSALVYVPDLAVPTRDRSDIYEGTLRLTWQATSKDKVQAFWSNNHTSQIPSLTGSQLDPIFIAPEGGSNLVTSPNAYQVKWVRPQTNRILFEFAAGMQPSHNILIPLTADADCRGDCSGLNARIDLPGAFEASNLTMSRNMAFFFHGTDVHFSTENTNLRGSMSYVTGSHNLKFGFSSIVKEQTESYRSGSDWTSLITFFGSPVTARFSARPAETNRLVNVGVYAQEQWTINRLTVNAGLRWDYFNGSYPDHVLPVMTWAPEERFFPGQTAAIWKDLQPRLGVVYDLFGDGKTALKASASRYGEKNAIALAGQLNPAANNIEQSRLWFDGALGCIPSAADPTGTSCIPGDGLVQGDPLNNSPNGEIFSPNTNLAFASPEVTNFFDPDWAFGWGNKEANWEFSGSVQHEVAPNMSLDVGYFRRVYINRSVQNNRALGAGDFDTYTLMVPQDPRLPNGGGFPITLVDVNNIVVPDNITTSADPFGGDSTTWHGVDFNFNGRLENVLFQGGYAVGKETNDNCELQAALPETINEAAGGLTGGGDSVVPVGHCFTEEPWISQASFSGAYTIPRIDLDISASFFSRQGTPRLAVITFDPAVVAAALGRQSNVTTVSANVIPHGEAYGDRLNQMDFRVGRLIDLGGTANLRASFDIYNLFNANAVAREQYGIQPGAADDDYLTPLGLQPGRLAKVSLQFNF